MRQTKEVKFETQDYNHNNSFYLENDHEVNNNLPYMTSLPKPKKKLDMEQRFNFCMQAMKNTKFERQNQKTFLDV